MLQHEVLARVFKATLGANESPSLHLSDESVGGFFKGKHVEVLLGRLALANGRGTVMLIQGLIVRKIGVAITTHLSMHPALVFVKFIVGSSEKIWTLVTKVRAMHVGSMTPHHSFVARLETA